MDKYTVDLDKVLNDFEYSELTDQYSVGAASQPLNNSSAPRQPDLYKLRNPPIKHTINNVFQSLNEYLNTDIGGKSKPSEFSRNDIKDTNVVAGQEGSVHSVSPWQGFSSISSTQCVGLKNDPQAFGAGLVAAVQECNSIATNNVITIKPCENVSYSEAVSNCNQNVEHSVLKDKIVENITSQNVPGVAPSALIEVASALVELPSFEAQLEPESVILDPPNYEEATRVDARITSGNIHDVETKINQLEINQIKVEVEQVHPETETRIPDAKTYLETKPNYPETEQNYPEPKPSENQPVDPTEFTEPIEKPPKTDLLEIEKVESPQPAAVVGFDESFGLDDSELHQYLDELENEYEPKDGEDNQIEAAVEVPVEKSTPQAAIPVVEVTVDDLNEQPSDINQETEPDVDDNNPVSRPSSLQINNQTQIDLVGEPGSTPYNNMYISKTLPVSEPAPESDSEDSHSASPTFSDISTDTAGSTVSTESVTDSIEDKELKPEPESNLKEIHADNTENLENISNNNVDDSEGYGSEGYGVADEGMEGASANATVTEVLVANDDHSLEVDRKDEEGVGDVHSDNVGLDSNSTQQEVVPEQNSGPSNWLGKQAPLWIPDSEALNCLHCDTKFTVIKRRHHCRACGLVLCSKCCNMKLRLEYLDAEARVCLRCYDILNRDTNSSSGSEVSPTSGNSPSRQLNQPNPNNPMEYCSMVPPLQQVSGTSQNPPTVMVPVGVLKRKGSAKSRTNKSVMFCDGIRPGSELTNLDNDFNYNESRSSNSKKGSSPPPPKVNRNAPAVDATTKSFIPNAENSLPPTVTVFKSDISYTECANNSSVVEMLKNEPLTFALQSNLHVHVKIINMECCINKCAWCFSTEGMIAVGQDEIVLLLEFIDNETMVPKDMFYHLNGIFNDAKKGTSITEYGISLHGTTNFLESKNHIGFLYIRPTFQCLQNVIVPKEPYLIGILVHRWEMPWAKIFPLRLILRLGAEYRYYPSPIISTRQRESVFVEIGHTIINLLADFRNFSYTLPNIRGLTIHMEDKNTTVTIPSNRYEQVMKSISNSSDHILAFGGNFSVNADSHLVCIQDTHGNNENTYTTHAINILNRSRKVTGASFIVFNGALKSSSGLTAKSSIVEDGLMIQIPAEHMLQIRDSLRHMKNHTIQCGCINATSDETVNIVWGENDVNFNTGVLSSIDSQPLGGIPSIRVHNGKDYVCNSGNRIIRWTEVFILQNGDENTRGQDIDFSKLSESISKATCQALVKYLDLLSSNNFYKIGIRTTLHVENVSYSAGSNGMKLPPIYMKSLDNELIPVLHRITSNNLGESAIVLELVFRILNV